jgi:hypothetical protein
MLNNLVCSLIKHSRVKTTLAKAKAARVVAEKMVTLGKKGQSEGVGLQYSVSIGVRMRMWFAFYLRISFLASELAMVDILVLLSSIDVRAMPPRWLF